MYIESLTLAYHAQTQGFFSVSTHKTDNLIQNLQLKN